MNNLNEWAFEERKLTQEFENKVFNLDLSKTENELILIDLITEIHAKITKIDDNFASFLFKIFSISGVLNNNKIELKIPDLESQGSESIAVLKNYFDEDTYQQKFKLFSDFMAITILSYKLTDYKKNNRNIYSKSLCRYIQIVKI